MLIVFEDQIGRNIEAYIADIVEKLKQRQYLLQDLEETFTNFRKYEMKLNPNKCFFGTTLGKLLGYMVSERGIDANPKKVRAFEEIKPLNTRRDIHKLVGMVAALNHFISKSGEWGMPFDKMLRKVDGLHWDKKTEKAFHELKAYLQTLPTLMPPLLEEELLLYVAANDAVLSVVLAMDSPLEDGNYQ